MGPAIVQRAELSDRHVRTAFTVSMLVGFAVAAAVVAAAPLAAAIMREPALTSVLRVLSIGMMLQSSMVVSGALMRRQLDFKRQALIETTSSLVGLGGVAVVLALAGFGVWSLVWGGLVAGLLMSTAQMAVARHSVLPLLGARELRDLLHFGIGSTLSGLVSYIAVNGDNLLVGRLMGAASVGLYSRAYNLMSVPHTYASTIISSVLFPAFSQVQTDVHRLRRAYLLVTQLMAMIAAPVMVGMAVAAPHLIAALYGPQWTDAAVPLQVLCIAGYFRAFTPLSGVVAHSAARVYTTFALQLGYASFVVAGVWLGSQFGLAGVAAGVGLAILYMFFGLGHLALSIIGMQWRTFLQAQFLAYATAGMALVTALAVRMLLEAADVPSMVIVVAIASACAGPWGLGVLWKLGDPGFEQLRLRLPAACLKLVDDMRRLRRAPAARLA
jgi:PST family polysaccharide transporter